MQHSRTISWGLGLGEIHAQSLGDSDSERSNESWDHWLYYYKGQRIRERIKMEPQADVMVMSA